LVQAQKNVAIYCRVSTEDQDNDRQRRDLEAFAKRANLNVIANYKETASGAKNDRKVRAEVLQLARQRKIDAVLVTELTRWGRSTQDLLATLQQLAEWNVSLICQTGMDFDLSTAQGKLLLTVMSGFSQFERDLITERTKSGLAAAKARGVKLGRTAGENLTVDKHSKKILALVDSGHSYREIADRLNISKTTVNKAVKLSKAM